MTEHKMNWRCFFIFSLLLGVLLLGGKVVFMIINNQVTYEDGEIELSMRIILLILLFIVLSSYLFSFLVLLRQYIKFKGRAFTLTEHGIENALTFIYVLAFVFVFPVKLIPWKSVKSIEKDEKGYTAYINTKGVRAGVIARLLLKINGFHFFDKLASPRISRDDIDLFYRTDSEQNW